MNAQYRAGNRTSNAVARIPRQPRVNNMGGMVNVTGSELVGSVTLQFNGTANAISANPYLFTGTWLNRQASMYNKYKYVNARLRFVPFCPTSTAGRIIIGWDADPNDLVPTNPVPVTQLENAREAPIWMENSASMGVIRKPEFTIGVAGDTDHSPGNFVIWTDNGTGSSAVTVGSLYMDYSINFWSRAGLSTQG